MADPLDSGSDPGCDSMADLTRVVTLGRDASVLCAAGYRLLIATAIAQLVVGTGGRR